jgi:hypothetical protein
LADILTGNLPSRTARRIPPPQLLDAWRRAVGELIAERARPVCLEEDGELVVTVTGSAWRQELTLLSPTIRADLVAAGWPISRLKLVNAPSAAPSPPPPPPVELGPEDEEGIRRIVQGARAPDLRQALASLMRAQMKAGKQARTLESKNPGPDNSTK